MSLETEVRAVRGAKNIWACSRALMERGPCIIPVLVAEMGLDELTGQGCLGDLLTAQSDPDALPALLGALEAHRPHTLSVLGALGAHRSDAARSALYRFIDDGDEWARAQRSEAIRALGNNGDARTLEYLQRRMSALCGGADFDELERLCKLAEEQFETGILVELVSTIVAMSKLGSMEFAAVVPFLLCRRYVTEFDAYVVRERAAAALQHLADPSIWGALTLAPDPDVEVRRHICRALYHWGAPEGVPALIAMLDDTDYEVAGNSALYVEGLLGEVGAAPDWTERWKQLREGCEPGVPLRGGVPLDIGRLILDLEEHRDLVAELQLFTGETFGQLPFRDLREQDQLIAASRAWWKLNQDAYPAGHVYRYGRAWSDD